MQDKPPVLDGLRSEFLDPHGPCVYLLWGDKDYPEYVGASENNLCCRIGKHVSYWGAGGFAVKLFPKVQILRCTDHRNALRLEKDLIQFYDPPLNTRYRLP
jgi:hypothetical protein